MSKPADRELSWRAVLTGVALGALLSLCNIYSGLKIGWGFNMSITAALLGFAFWRASQAAVGTAPFGKLENNLNQTGASAGASISSAGLVSAIPALTMLTGRTFSWVELATWTALISLVGVLVGVALRRQMIEVDRLPFANGIASAETLERMYASGSEAIRKVFALLGAASIAASLKSVVHFWKVPHLGLPGAIPIGARTATPMNFTFALDPSPLMIAFGALGSLRAGVSMLAGATTAWLVIAPIAVTRGWAQAGPDPSAPWFGPIVGWLLWPGVAMMVTSSLTSVAFSWRAIVATFRGGAGLSAGDVGKREYLIAALVVGLLVTVGQVVLFGIAWWAALLAVALTVVLAAVAGRVSGETTITPVGPMGKITQMVFGALVPAKVSANLMSANVTGGAAAQAGDLLHDFKTGALIGASPRSQAIAQAAGVLGGAALGSAAYLVLLPDPARQVGSTDWPAPAVQTWKVVAEVFAEGLGAMPPYALHAMAIGGAVGVVLTVLEKTLPEKVRVYVPSASAFGLAFAVQAWYALSFFLGALLGWILRRFAPAWSEQWLTPIAAGVIAGESLMGVSIALWTMLR